MLIRKKIKITKRVVIVILNDEITFYSTIFLLYNTNLFELKLSLFYNFYNFYKFYL